MRDGMAKGPQQALRALLRIQAHVYERACGMVLAGMRSMCDHPIWRADASSGETSAAALM